ncbi:MAG: Ribosomal protein S12 methylthiotransferase accessory factor YcaO [Betaproteobacteria bacterium ADurb.Bin341]|nr:MAG: Ribosomal protein S12 methylthiotransferase accessory factor YcaO [Betaproteobacteria bacterium ADurb.Bin341]
MEHFIAGKDASLEQTVGILQQKLAALGFQIEERSWLHPLDGVWSVHVRDRECQLLFTNGKGATQLAALASALGEFFERLSCHYFWNHYYLGAEIAGRAYVHDPRERWFALPEDGSWPEELLTPELQAFYNPEGSIPASSLVDFNSGASERGICALPYTRLRDGCAIWVPVNILSNLYVSNGMAAGNTPHETRAQALAEILERYVKFHVIGEGLCLPDLPEAVMARSPNSVAGIGELRAAGFGVLVKDASLGGRFPVINVTLINPRDQGCFASFGAHPRLEIALERALTELLQGRALDALDGFPAPSFNLDEVASPQNLESHFVDSDGLLHWNFFADAPDFEFVDWDSGNTTTAEDEAWLIERIHDEGGEIYLAEFTHAGVYACRIVVPGMSEIYPVDELEWENNSVGNALRPAILNLPELDDEGCFDLLDGLRSHDIADEKRVAELIGLAPDEGSLWADLRVGELKLLLALACSEGVAIDEGCDWVRHRSDIAPERRRIYDCLHTLRQLPDRGCWAGAVDAFYGDAGQEAKNLLSRKRRFFGIAALGETLAGCVMHQRLLAVYQRVRAC